MKEKLDMRNRTVKETSEKKYLIIMPQEPKIKVGFFLTFPKVNTWNGKWTGEGDLHAIVKPYNNKGIILYPDLREGFYDYDFGDGWVAKVEVKFLTNKEARNITKNTNGFCGYEWMIDSIIKNGSICKGFS